MSRGDRLRESLLGLKEFGPADRELVEEAARIVDRLDRLDAVLAGDLDEWCRVEFRSGKDARLVIDDVLGEARQQANALRQIFATLKLAGTEAEEQGSDGIDEFSAKRAERRAAAALSESS